MIARATNGQAHGSPICLELVGVAKRYGQVQVLSDISLAVKKGEFVVLLGPSGCGKSTILKIIAGLEDATEGDVYIQGRLATFLRPKARDVAMVFQNYALYPHMTVEGNLAFPLKMRGLPREDIASRVGSIARLLALEDQLLKFPEQLSGGQRQRVALGRAMIRNPVAFLMDEPLSNLDALLRVQMRIELLKLHRSLGHATVYVTHDQTEAMTMADRVVVLRDGIVEQLDTPMAVYSRPANTFVATFVGSPQMNLFRGRLRSGNGQTKFEGAISLGITGKTPEARLAGEVTLGIRPEHIEAKLAPDGDTIPGRVDLVETVGAESYVSVALKDGSPCMVRVPGESASREGAQIWLRFPPEFVHLFDPEGLRIALA